jgi:transposase-like protein
MTDQDTETTTALTRVRAAAATAREANQALVVEVRAALDSGESVSAVAGAADVTRQTIYRWRDQEAAGRARVHTRQAIDDALVTLLTVGVGPAATADIAATLAATNLPLVNRAQRVERGMRSLITPMRQLSEDDRRMIEIGQIAAAAVLAHPDNPPTSVRIDRA